MIKSIILKISKSIMLLLIFFKANAQINIVPNGNLETYTTCPKATGAFQFPPIPPWLALATNYWSYVNACANNNPANWVLGVPVNMGGGGIINTHILVMVTWVLKH